LFIKYSDASFLVFSHLSFINLPTFSPNWFSNFCNLAGDTFVILSISFSAHAQASLLTMALPAFSHAQAIGNAHHNAAHIAKSFHVGNSLSDTMLYSHISAAHSIAHAATFHHSQAFLNAHNFQAAQGKASLIAHSIHIVCAKSVSHFVTLYVHELVLAFTDLDILPSSK